MVRPYRKPLIVMTPKSLLRHKLATSPLQDLAEGEFHLIIKEIDDIKADKVRKVVLCCGKVYYDLLMKRRENKQTDIAILRIEQLYPFPKANLIEELQRYQKAKEIVWCQEESKNQGAWYSIKHCIEESLASWQTLSYVGRKASASPATGHTLVHLKNQQLLVDQALE
jgi:2-oxoglutarate dehydrogenase E1 component